MKKQKGGNSSNTRRYSRSRSATRRLTPRVRQGPPDIDVNSTNIERIDALGMEVYRLKMENQEIKIKYETLNSELKYIKNILGVKQSDIIYEVSG